MEAIAIWFLLLLGWRPLFPADSLQDGPKGPKEEHEAEAESESNLGVTACSFSFGDTKSGAPSCIICII